MKKLIKLIKAIKKEIKFILKNCSVDPSLYQFLPYMLGTILFVIITVTMTLSV